eukprot:6176934-Amphidinium_carterae.1
MQEWPNLCGDCPRCPAMMMWSDVEAEVRSVTLFVPMTSCKLDPSYGASQASKHSNNQIAPEAVELHWLDLWYLCQVPPEVASKTLNARQTIRWTVDPYT